MSRRKERKAPPRQTPDKASETWARLPWRKLEQHVYRLQKRIFRASHTINDTHDALMVPLTKAASLRSRVMGNYHARF